MDKPSSNNILQYEHISSATDEILKYIDDRRRGVVESLKTRWKKFNKMCMGGIEPNSIYVVAGISGSGKSSFISSLEEDLFELNPGNDFVILDFTFEMKAARSVGRKLSYRLKKTTSELYSSVKTIEQEDYDKAVEVSGELREQQIYYVEIPGTVREIRNTILEFSQNIAKDKWLIIILDHSLLTRGRSGDKEREILADLQYMFMEMKKYGKNTIIELSQLNRQIESTERINNNYMHFPTRSDLFGSESLYQAADYLMVLHRPEILNIPEKTGYGPHGWPVKNLIYMHLLKNRDGEVGIIPFENNLKYNRIDEIDSKKVESKSSIGLF